MIVLKSVDLNEIEFIDLYDGLLEVKFLLNLISELSETISIFSKYSSTEFKLSKNLLVIFRTGLVTGSPIKSNV